MYHGPKKGRISRKLLGATETLPLAESGPSVGGDKRDRKAHRIEFESGFLCSGLSANVQVYAPAVDRLTSSRCG